MKGVIYQNTRLMPKSYALQLHEEGKHEALAKHMAQLNVEAKRRGDFVPPKLKWCDECGEGTLEGMCRKKNPNCQFTRNDK